MGHGRRPRRARRGLRHRRAPRAPRGDRHRAPARATWSLWQETEFDLLRRAPQPLPGVRRPGGPDRRRHRRGRGAGDRLRRPGRASGPRPGGVVRALPAAVPRLRPLPPAPRRREEPHDEAAAAPDRGARDGRRGRGDRRRRQRLDRHRGRQHLPGRPGRLGALRRQHRRPAAGHRALRRGPPAHRRRARRAADDEHASPEWSSGSSPRSTGSGWCSATTPPSPRNGDIWFSDSSTVYPIEQWKADFVEHTEHRPAAVPPGRRDASRCTSTGSPSPTASRSRRTSRSSAWPSRVAATVVRLWLTGSGQGRPTCSPTTCPATPTTSPAAATA